MSTLVIGSNGQLITSNNGPNLESPNTHGVIYEFIPPETKLMFIRIYK